MKRQYFLPNILQVTILPKSADEDLARKEFILNILLAGSSVLAFTAFSINVSNSARMGLLYKGESPMVTGSIFLFFCFLWLLSRIGKVHLAASLLILLLTFLGMYVGYRWGADLAQGLLLYSLIIVMAGIVLSSRAAFSVAIFVGVVTYVLAYTENHGIHVADYHSKREIIQQFEAIIYGATLFIIALVSWLSNREIKRALNRAIKSETDLKHERDNLEITVEERTKELKIAQASQLSQLYRFAQFGRMTSGYFHDLATPLSLVSLNLDRLRRESKGGEKQQFSDSKEILSRAMNATKQLELYVQAARKEIQNQTDLKVFSIKDEIDQVILMLQYKARKNSVRLFIEEVEDISVFGNSLKFYQLVSNLVSNAIDAYASTSRKTRKVVIRFQTIKKTGILEVQDWGSGISDKDLPHIFDPLFTTKSVENGMGMGLSISRDIAEIDLRGKLFVKSEKNIGTTFTVEFPVHKRKRNSA